MQASSIVVIDDFQAMSIDIERDYSCLPTKSMVAEEKSTPTTSTSADAPKDFAAAWILRVQRGLDRL